MTGHFDVPAVGVAERLALGRGKCNSPQAIGAVVASYGAWISGEHHRGFSAWVVADR